MYLELLGGVPVKKTPCTVSERGGHMLSFGDGDDRHKDEYKDS